MIQAVSPTSLSPILKKAAALLTPLAREAWVFGSAAEGYAIPYESDVDLLIIPSKKYSLETVYKRLKPVHTQLLDKGLVLHIILFDPARHTPELLAAARKGMRLV